MKKLDYFKNAIQSKKFLEMKWVVSVFAMTRSSQTVDQLEYYDVYSTPVGYSFKIGDGVTTDKSKGSLVSIEDAAPSKPLFSFLDPIEVDKSWISNAPEQPTMTTYGNVIFNACSVQNSFEDKLPFVFGQVNIEKVEEAIAKLLISNDDEPKSPNSIFVHEYIAFVNSLQFILNLAPLCVVSATEKNIQIAPGLEEFKKALIAKYGDKLKDPTEYVNFENELKAFDDEYLKGDPSTRGFMKGRIKDVARKKMYLTIGTEAGFDPNSYTPPVINSLHEKWPSKDPVQFTSLMNGLRSGSFSRGNETMRGGVAAKILLRSASNFKVIDSDCGTTLGITRLYRKNDIGNLVQRYVIENKQPVLVDSEEAAEKYLGHAIQVRSPMYCKVPGDAICKICAGQKLSSMPNGLTIPLTEISSIILSTSLKAMHGKVLSTQELEIEEVFS